MFKNTIICSRPGVGKTQKAIDYYIDKISSGINGVYCSLENKDTILMDRILKTCDFKNIKLSSDTHRNLYINDNAYNFVEIIKYVQAIDEKINFVIIDYLQLINKTDEEDFKQQLDLFFNYCKESNLDVVLLSQLKRGVEKLREVQTEMTLESIVWDKYILNYIDDGYLLTSSCDEIYYENKRD